MIYDRYSNDTYSVNRSRVVQQGSLLIKSLAIMIRK